MNYCESKEFGDDDEDFACAKPPPSKKSKETLKQPENRKSISSQELSSRSQSQKSRKPLDVKLYERDLEAAISLSMLNPSNEKSNQSPSSTDDVIVQTAPDGNTDPTVAHLSNCSVDGLCLGLDQITSEATVPSKEKKEASDIKKNKVDKQDDDYQPCAASDSESDNDYSEHESEDEEFTVKKASKTKKVQVSQNGKAKQVSSKQQKKPQKSAVSTPKRTPQSSIRQNVSVPTSSVSSKVSKQSVCLSPGVSRLPKWNPPGQIGKSPSSNGAPVRSPGQGLRLGLSRLVRVKPLHPSVASH